jgi:NADH-quinone oxidoreductase subunit F
VERILFQHVDVPDINRMSMYVAHGGYDTLKRAVTDTQPAEVTRVVSASGLAGRGGAGFPTGRKWSFIPMGVLPTYLVVNADESEPGAFKDRELMERNPHQLLEGVAISSYAIGCQKAFSYIRGEFLYIGEILEQAIAEAYEAGYLGDNIFDSGVNIEIIVHRGAGAYICGEESALLDSLEGYRGQPRLRPPFPAVKGLYGQPTVVNSVETIANVPHIVKNGAAWFRSLGTEQSPGTKICSISRPVNRPGNYEMEMSTPFRVLLEERAGGMRDGKKLKAYIPGGALGGAHGASLTEVVVDLEAEARAQLDYRVIRANAEAVVAFKAVAAGHAAASFEQGIGLVQAAEHLLEGALPPDDIERRLHRLVGVGVVPRVEHAKGDNLVLGRRIVRGVTEIGVDVARGLLSMPQGDIGVEPLGTLLDHPDTKKGPPGVAGLVGQELELGDEPAGLWADAGNSLQGFDA